MPASQPFHQAPVAEICGAKRKAESSSEVEFLYSDFDERHPLAKRICRYPDELSLSLNADDMNNHQPDGDRGMNCNGFTASMKLHSDSYVQDVPDGDRRCSDTGMHEWHVNDTIVPNGNCDAESDNMEVDCAMEYDACSTTPAQVVPAEANYSFCETRLETSSTASVGHRCYCRPSWECTALMRSSLSDYF